MTGSQHDLLMYLALSRSPVPRKAREEYLTRRTLRRIDPVKPGLRDTLGRARDAVSAARVMALETLA